MEYRIQFHVWQECDAPIAGIGRYRAVVQNSLLANRKLAELCVIVHESDANVPEVARASQFVAIHVTNRLNCWQQQSDQEDDGDNHGHHFNLALASRTRLHPIAHRSGIDIERHGFLHSKFHELQLQITIRRLSTLMEPAIVVVVGSIVGYVYIAFFVAMFAAAGGGR